MKKLLMSILLPLLMLAGLSAKAQDVTVTVTWNLPGAVLLYQGYPADDNSNLLPIQADATSYIITTKDEFRFVPASGYILESATIDGVSQSLNVFSYSDPRKIYIVNTKWYADTLNGKTVELHLVKEVFDSSFTLNINNGAEKLNVWLSDDAGSVTHNLTVVNGQQTIEYTAADKKLNFQTKSFPRTELYEVTLDGTAIEPADVYMQYTMPISQDCNVYVAVAEPATLDPKCKVTFEFTNNDPYCLSNIRNWEINEFIMPDKLVEGYVLEIDKGGELTLNFNEDYTINDVTANGTSIGEPYGGRRLTIESDTKFVINATEKIYPSLSAKVYTNNIEALVFTKEFGATSDVLTATEVADCPAGTVTLASGFTIPVDTKEYDVTGISGKTMKMFYDVKPGYWLIDGELGNPADSDDSSLVGRSLIFQNEAPAYLNIGTIDYTAPAAVYVETPANTSRLLSYYAKGDAKEPAAYQGQKDYLATGWNDIKFDPEYNNIFEARINVSESESALSKYVYLDGTAIAADENDVFSNIYLKPNSVLKMFLSAVAPKSHTIDFDVTGNVDASLSYDHIVTLTDFSNSIVNVGTVEYTLTAAEGAVVELNGQVLTPVDGKYVFTPTATTNTLTVYTAIPCELEPAAGTTVRSLDSFSILFGFEALGEGSLDIVEDAMSKVTVSDGTTTYNPAYVEPGEPTETAIPMTFYLMEPITEAGTYTITVPAGVFFQTFYDEASGEFVRTAASSVNAAATTSVVVDPNMVYTWVCTPADGSVNDLPDDICVIKLSLPDAKSLSSDPYDENAFVTVMYNGTALAKVEDPDTQTGWSFVPMWGEAAVRIFISADVFTKAGILTISAEEGAMTVDYAEASPALEYTAQFGEIKEYSYVFNPEAESEVSAFESITLTFTNAETVVLDEYNKYFIFKATDNSWATENVEVSCQGNTVTFTPEISEDVVLRAGSYTLLVGAESFTLDGNQASPEISASWTLVRTTDVNFDFEASPTGTLVNEGYGLMVAFVFGEEEIVTAGNNFADCELTFNGEPIAPWSENVTDEQMCYMTEFDMYMRNVVMFGAMGGAIYTDEGIFTVTIPVGGINVSGTPNPTPLTYTWNVVLPKEYDIVINPADGTKVPLIETVTITFSNAETAELSEYFNLWQISLRKSDYSKSYNAVSVELVADAQHPSFDISFGEPITAQGSYDLNISYGAFVLDGVQESNSIEATIIVDPTVGIDAVMADANGKYTVCNLQGMIVLENAEAEDVKTLPAGFYIINGIKVVVK